ncbi:DUF4330 domain-containing protein [Haladaptatus sp. ZSTT2]|uniref:DUF4330 domain-containing protein n=1 Tax=Haladaptatus sp. ZSTT2 TaxID=3120515 RepID=UPI00300EFD81
MPLLDSDGNLFGLVNIIDAFVILLVIAVVGAGGALVLGDDAADPATNNTTATPTPTPTATPQNQTNNTTAPPPTENVSVVYRLESVPKYLLEPIEEGPVNATDSLVEVEAIEVISETNETVTAELTVETTLTMKDELRYYNGERIYVGKRVTLDFGDVVVKPTVIRFA